MRGPRMTDEARCRYDILTTCCTNLTILICSLDPRRCKTESGTSGEDGDNRVPKIAAFSSYSG